jgi:aminoglycoside 2''-phosphotransferase
MKRLYSTKQIIDILNNNLKNFTVNDINYLNSGNDCDAFCVNNNYVFKFPKNIKASENLLKEFDILNELKHKLPLEIPDAVFLCRTYTPSDYFNYNFIGCTKIKGKALTPEIFNSLSEKVQDNIIYDLASFLKELHNIKINEKLNNYIDDVPLKYKNDQKKIKNLIYEYLNTHQQECIENMYNKIYDDNDFFNYKPCVIHNDLSSDHIFYDDKSNKISGIIDFGDARIGDADNDFMCLLEDGEEYGQKFGLKVLEYYNHKNIKVVLKKFNFRELYWSFEKVLYGYEYSLDDYYNEGLKEIKEKADKNMLMF